MTLLVTEGLCNAGAAEDLPVVAEGKALARIVVPANPSPTIDQAASLLVEYVSKSTDVKLEKGKESASPEGTVSIHCGPTGYVQSLDLNIDKLDQDGFVIAFPDASHIVLTGPSDLSVEYAADEFLERYVGVRWLLPGTIGEYVPKRKSLTIPAVEVRQEPAFRHRLLCPAWGTDSDPGLWLKRHRTHDRIQFHHNLWKLFLPEKYTATHPEFFPMIDGKRYLPAPPAGKTSAEDAQAQTSWQPCFTAPGIVEEAVRSIGEYFEKNPTADSFSLGINDCSRYCTCPTCTAMDGGGNNALDERDISRSYYTWCNAVAAGVNARFPDKRFGLLACYGAYLPPPGMKLHPSLVPFDTYDRMKWADSTLEKEGHAVTEKWGAAAASLGWYDYIYGGQRYLAPRVYFHRMAKYLRYGYGHKVRSYFAEMYSSPDWHEGPKLYVTLKLLWNPNQNVDRLLDDWYLAAVGPQAAPHLARYFAQWEKFWTKDVLKSDWFIRNGNWHWLDFGSNAYLEVFSLEKLNRCEESLREAVRLAPKGIQRERARYFLDGFLCRKEELAWQIRRWNPHKKVEVLAEVQKSAFATDADGWGNWQGDLSKAQFSHDAQTGRAAAGSLKVDTANSQNTPLVFLRSIPVSNGKTCRASVWFKGEGLDSKARVALVMKWQDQNGKWLNNIPFVEAVAPLPIADDWKQLEVYFETGNDAKWEKLRSVFYLRTYDGKWKEMHFAVPMFEVRDPHGQVWFDDFEFEEVSLSE